MQAGAIDSRGRLFEREGGRRGVSDKQNRVGVDEVAEERRERSQDLEESEQHEEGEEKR